MNAPRIVGPRQHSQVVAALAEGQVIGVPGTGGYQLAAALGSDAALLALNALVEAGPAAPRHVVVGRWNEAPALASEWSETTGQLTESVWPGPVMVRVPARDGLPFGVDRDDGSVRLTMATTRALRLVCRHVGPLAAVAPSVHGEPLATAEVLRSRFSSVGLVLDTGPCRGPGPTEVDCRVSPPAVRVVGELPAAYIDAVVLMAARRRKRFAFLHLSTAGTELTERRASQWLRPSALKCPGRSVRA